MSTFAEHSQKWGEMMVFEDPWEPYIVVKTGGAHIVFMIAYFYFI